jgi:hypothetical protein
MKMLVDSMDREAEWHDRQKSRLGSAGVAEVVDMEQHFILAGDVAFTRHNRILQQPVCAQTTIDEPLAIGRQTPDLDAQTPRQSAGRDIHGMNGNSAGHHRARCKIMRT